MTAREDREDPWEDLGYRAPARRLHGRDVEDRADLSKAPDLQLGPAAIGLGQAWIERLREQLHQVHEDES